MILTTFGQLEPKYYVSFLLLSSGQFRAFIGQFANFKAPIRGQILKFKTLLLLQATPPAQAPDSGGPAVQVSVSVNTK